MRDNLAPVIILLWLAAFAIAAIGFGVMTGRIKDRE